MFIAQSLRMTWNRPFKIGRGCTLEIQPPRQAAQAITILRALIQSSSLWYWIGESNPYCKNENLVY